MTSVETSFKPGQTSEGDVGNINTPVDNETSKPGNTKVISGREPRRSQARQRMRYQGSFWQKNQFVVIVISLQVVFLILFGLYGEYSTKAMPQKVAVTTGNTKFVNTYYPLFQDVHVMILIGFGFLMTFLRKYGFTAVSINLLLTSTTIEWAIIVNGFLSDNFKDKKVFQISIIDILSADFAAATVLISMGATLGKLSPPQYIIMAIVETAVSLCVEYCVGHEIRANDIGDSMVVHTFGAYFGLALCKAMRQKRAVKHCNDGSNYNSDLLSMIGAIFLWVFWPSFNASVATPEDARHRALLNTYLSLVACTVLTFVLSQRVDAERRNRFNITHIANSTLAGGVAIGTVSNVVLDPLAALLVGSGAAIISVYGFAYLTPFLARKFGIHDTCGVNNLHGMPGIYAGLLGFLFALMYAPSRYYESIYDIYPAFLEGRTALGQAWHQLVALALVLSSSILSGYLTGMFLRTKMWNQVTDDQYYSDEEYWEIPQDYEFTTTVIPRIKCDEMKDGLSVVVNLQ